MVIDPDIVIRHYHRTVQGKITVNGDTLGAVVRGEIANLKAIFVILFARGVSTWFVGIPW